MRIAGLTGGGWLRLIALVSLAFALMDAASLLGASTGATNQIAHFGVVGFTFAAAIMLMRLFASVGLWIEASWGAVVLVGATLAEAAIFLFGPTSVRLPLSDMGMRFALALAIALIFGARIWNTRERLHD